MCHPNPNPNSAVTPLSLSESENHKCFILESDKGWHSRKVKYGKRSLLLWWTPISGALGVRGKM